MLKKRALTLTALLACSLLMPLGSAGPTATASPVDTDNCGPTVLKADGTAWECTFADDFDGTELDRSKWMPQTIGFRTGTREGWACYVDSPEVIRVADGVLSLGVVKDAEAQPCDGLPGTPATPYRAGSVSTYHLFSQQYGRFEARIHATATDQPGLQEAFWLWPDTREHSTALWPVTGEIDIAETYSQHPDLAIPFLHSATDLLGPVPGVNTAYCDAQRGVWNTFTLEWSPSRLEIFVNGTSCLVSTVPDPAFMKNYIVALTQLLGAKNNAVSEGTPIPATMSVDHVRVWR